MNKIFVKIFLAINTTAMPVLVYFIDRTHSTIFGLAITWLVLSFVLTITILCIED